MGKTCCVVINMFHKITVGKVLTIVQVSGYLSSYVKYWRRINREAETSVIRISKFPFLQVNYPEYRKGKGFPTQFHPFKETGKSVSGFIPFASWVNERLSV